MVCVDSGFFCYLLWYCFWVIVEIAENVVGIGYILAIFGVVPCVGTWIEIMSRPRACLGRERRPLRGDVD